MLIVRPQTVNSGRGPRPHPPASGRGSGRGGGCSGGRGRRGDPGSVGVEIQTGVVVPHFPEVLESQEVVLGGAVASEEVDV